MLRTSCNRIAAAVVAGCAGLALANAAGAVDLRDWGRKIAASERFVVLSQFDNEAVLDKETQLVWQRMLRSLPAQNWYDAASNCRSISIGSRLGWRLPSLHEMQSLVNASAASGTLALPSGHPFQSVPAGGYWTATRHTPQTSSSFVYYVDMTGGGNPSVSAPSYASHYYWCVRGGAAIAEY